MEDLARNSRFVEQFGVNGFPTVVLTDAKGRIFGELGGYKPGGVDAYVAALRHGKDVGEKLLPALDRISAPEDDQAKRELASDVLRIVRENKLEKYYATQVPKWKDLANGPVIIPQPINPPKIPPLPEGVAGMTAEEFLKKCGLVPYAGKWLLPEDKEMVEGSLRALYNQARDLDHQVGMAEAARTSYEQAAKARSNAAKELDALHEKPRVFSSELQRAQQGVERAETAARDAEAAADAARARAENAAAQLEPKLDKLRKTLDYGTRYYAKLADAEAVKKAIAELNNRDDAKKVLLGPSDLFDAAAPRLEEIAKKVARALHPQPVAVDFRDEHGSSYVQVSLNDKKTMEMVVDSGANTVSLPWAIAIDIGLNPVNGREVIVKVGNGRKYVALEVTIPVVRVGGAVARNVKCAVDPPEYADAPLLLGKSFLKHFKWELDEVKRKLVFSKALDDEAELPRGRR